MNITKLRTNHVENPLGFDLNPLRLSWITENSTIDSNFQVAAQVEISIDENFIEIVFDSKKDETINSLGFYPDITLQPRTRYYWRVTVWGDKGDMVTSEPAWFETAKMGEVWQGRWIKPDLTDDVHPLIRKTVTLHDDVVSARAYMCGLGLYELQINGKKAGDEFFAPGYHAYDFWLQYQTYDITDLLQVGDNSIGLLLGNGWYKGRFGFDGGYHNLYGDEFSILGEIVLTHQDGSTTVIGTNNEWKCAPSPIVFSGIYDGEIYDANNEILNWSTPVFDDFSWLNVTDAKDQSEYLQSRLSLPVKIMEEIKPLEIITTPKDEIVLDFGQNMTGWVRFKVPASKGQEYNLQYGETLQDGCFYRDNLRTAKAEYVFISDGEEREVQPYFTFYGFRYVKLIGFGTDVKLEDFTACVMYSEMEETGSIETSDADVNRLFLNALWGQKGNFLDVPTDCPQRDERMGWTGDAQIFAMTACYNMYSPAFYTKYLKDLREEQKRINGSVPFVVPTLKPEEDAGFVTGKGSSAWGDAATIIPWTLYLQYGDTSLLSSHFEMMKDWVDYIIREDEKSGATRLWKTGFHFGDWLALDGKNPHSPMGGTETSYVASAYYFYSTSIVAKAAQILGKTDLADYYNSLASEVKEAIINEYFTPNGRSALETQTAMILALYMDLVPESYRARIIDDLKNKLREDNMHLTTGFVGTPYICNTLSGNGANDYAYTLLMNDDYPSWLYAVKLGATTLWERWNSVLPDGKISGTDMNSLNHYAYGSIAEWMYRYMCGINPVEESPGFKKIKLAPQPYGKLNYAKASFHSPSGLIKSQWEIKDDGSLSFSFVVPFDTSAELILPDADMKQVKVNGVNLVESIVRAEQDQKNVLCQLIPGEYKIEYIPTDSYILTYSIDNEIKDLMEQNETKKILIQEISDFVSNPIVVRYNGDKTLRELAALPFGEDVLTDEVIEKLERRLSEVRR